MPHDRFILPKKLREENKLSSSLPGSSFSYSNLARTRVTVARKRIILDVCLPRRLISIISYLKYHYGSLPPSGLDTTQLSGCKAVDEIKARTTSIE